MRGSTVRTVVAAVLSMVGMAVQVDASITRVSGPVDLVAENRAFVKFDTAYDSANRVYLVVWGTQLHGPVNGMFLNEAGQIISGPFPVSDGPVQSGWARVLYSAQEGKFLVSYTKIIPTGPSTANHQKGARFVTYSNGSPILGGEIILAQWGAGAGTESGIGYSPAAGGRFFVTYWNWAPNPVSYIATLDDAGNVLGTQVLTNPADGQSDPEIACDPAANRCLAVGLAWGAFAAGAPSNWGRWINATTGVPEGPDSFYITSWPRLMEEQSVVFSAAASRFIVGYIRDAIPTGQLVNAADLGVGTPYVLLQPTAATWYGDAGGYGKLSLAYNSATQTTLLSTVTWLGYPSAQELNSNGQEIVGSIDFVPDAGGDFNTRAQWAVGVANPVNGDFLLLDNHYFQVMRVSRYATGPVAPPPPPCSRSVTPASASVGPSATSFTVTVTADCAWTATSGAGWLTVSAGASGSGNGTVTIAVAQNTASSGRSGALTIAGTTVTVNQAGFVPMAHVHDLSGDGYSDIVLYNEATTQVAVWTLQGPIVTGGFYLNNGNGVNPAWRIMGAGDLNGDGQADIVWRHNDGRLAVWFMWYGVVGQTRAIMNATDPNVSAVPATLPDLAWQLRGVGDVNGDGRADLIWQNDLDGRVSAWFMYDANIYEFSSVRFGSTEVAVALEWKIVGAGDINRDGRADIIWQHQSGYLAAWLMNGAQVEVTRHLSTWNRDLNYKVRGVGDVNGDGMADLLWQRADNGWLAVWYLDNFNVTIMANLSWGVPNSPSWKLVGPG